MHWICWSSVHFCAVCTDCFYWLLLLICYCLRVNVDRKLLHRVFWQFISWETAELSSNLLIALFSFIKSSSVVHIYTGIRTVVYFAAFFILCFNVHSSSVLTGVFAFWSCHFLVNRRWGHIICFVVKTVLLRWEYLMSSLDHSRELAEYLLLAYGLLEIGVNLHSMILISAAFLCSQKDNSRRWFNMFVRLR